MTLKGSKKDDKPEFWPEILRSCIDDIHSGGGRFFQQLGAQEMMQIVQDVTTTDFSRRMGKKLVLSSPYLRSRDFLSLSFTYAFLPYLCAFPPFNFSVFLPFQLSFIFLFLVYLSSVFRLPFSGFRRHESYPHFFPFLFNPSCSSSPSLIPLTERKMVEMFSALLPSFLVRL